METRILLLHFLKKISELNILELTRELPIGTVNEDIPNLMNLLSILLMLANL